MQSCKAQQNIVGDILNKVVQRADMDKPMPEKLPKKPIIPVQAIKTLKPEKPKNTLEEVSIREALKPKSLSDLAADIEMKSDSEDSDETEEEEEEIDYEVMPDNPKELKEAFRKLYFKFRSDIEMYNKLVLMLDELERMQCLTKEECSAVNEHLQKKLETRDLDS